MTSFQEMTFSELLSDAEVFVDGDWVESKDQDPNGDVRLIQLADIGDGFYIDKSSRFLNSETAKRLKCTYLEEGDILVARMPDPLGRACIFPKSDMPCVTVVDVCIIRPNQNKVDNRWLMHTINSPVMRQRINEYVTGTTRQRISRGNFSKLKISVPPLAEQRRIASILDQADELRQKRQQAIEKLEQLLQATFIDMFGDPVSNPIGWDVKKLENLTTKIGSGSTPKGGDSAYKDEGISLVRSLNIYDGQFSYKNLAFIDQDQADKLKNVILQANDVLLNITGASVARCCLVPNGILPARVNQHVSILRVKDNLIPEFLEALLISKPMKLHLLKISGAGATREALTKLQLQELEIIVPPLDIQNEFLLKLESIKCLIDLNSKQLNELDKLFISSQNQAFSGTL
ncbi:restriction endonuclease S subunits-like protein [Acinetobacter baumannii]|uniref:restriction endonuclease subunit S n=1 Tax=Acinetobacter baumannii TaxID=470 RepID=UPI000DE7460D|nr:restriction endonuclease subunit S [Acinetobacter baumannii]SSR11034.1 restriction endonuclease S subunits-like protein [Acinetobacter baumannii]